MRSPNGNAVKACALLDSGSSASFISERLAQGLNLPRSKHKIQISGVAGITQHSATRSVAQMQVSSTGDRTNRFSVSAVVVPRVTCDLPVQPVALDSRWSYLSDLTLTDPDFGIPGRIDVLLEMEIYSEALLNGRRSGPPGSPIAFET